MDYSYLRDIDLYKNLIVIRRSAIQGKKKFEDVLKQYPNTESLADVVLQSRKTIGLLNRIVDELGFIKRNLYYYRPQKRTLKTIKDICNELSESHHMNKKHGRNDIRKDMEVSEVTLNLINSAFDDNETVLLLTGVLEELSNRKGIYDNYIGDRLWTVIAGGIIALLTGIIGLLSGIILS